VEDPIAAGAAPLTVRRTRLSLETASGAEEVIVSSSPQGWSVLRGGRATGLDVAVLPDGRLSLLLEDGRQLCGRMVPDGKHRSVLLTTREGVSRVRIEDALRHRLGASAETDDGSGEEIRALMPGRVLAVSAREGDKVTAGELLLVVEAMKMQNEIRSSKGGTVDRVAVAPGEAVETGALLVAIGAET
jgi:biotin carboxyl carrier protein